MLMFAYGMNTNSEQMGTRCPAALSLGHAILPKFEFRFARHADVVPSDRHEVHGVLWDITDDCLDALDRLEGFPDYYDRTYVTVLHRGVAKSALVYFMQPGYPGELPADSYRDMVRSGYREHDVPTGQILRALTLAEQEEKWTNYE
jgi:gamma-glutamylcyclotransferase (GGCT)/AIG2-like uncharacterized protein YtfP